MHINKIKILKILDKFLVVVKQVLKDKKKIKKSLV